MSIIKDVLMWMGGGSTRNIGKQVSSPSHYSHESATRVTTESAMQLSAVWACVKLIAETIGTMPIQVLKVSDGGVETPFPEHRLAQLFRGKVNRWQTKQEFMECMVYQYALQGNAYSAIDRNTRGDMVQLIPLMTGQMQVDLQQSGEVLYDYQESNGRRIYAEKSIWHNKLFGNGIVGLSPIAYGRNSIGVGQAAEQSTTKIYQNGGKPSGLLMIDRVLKDEQREQIKKNFAELSEGNSDRLFVLEANMEFKQVSLSPQDIELLASRRFQIEDICRFFGVPSVLVNATQDTTAWGTGIGEIIQGFHKFGILPYTNRIAESMRCNLLTAGERDTMIVKFNFGALLEPDLATRIKTGKEGVTGGLMTPNEFRAREGWKAIDGGDKLFLQQQMTPIDMLEKIDRKGMQNAAGQDKEI